VQGGGTVRAFPGEAGLVSAEVAVGGGRAVDRAAQVQGLDQGGGPQVEMGAHQVRDERPRDLLGAERLDEQGERPGHPDRVSDLDLGPVGQARGHDVLGHVPRRVRR
jgi:hypothetical protein